MDIFISQYLYNRNKWNNIIFILFYYEQDKISNQLSNKPTKKITLVVVVVVVRSFFFLTLNQDRYQSLWTPKVTLKSPTRDTMQNVWNRKWVKENMSIVRRQLVLQVYTEWHKFLRILSDMMLNICFRQV